MNYPNADEINLPTPRVLHRPEAPAIAMQFMSLMSLRPFHRNGSPPPGKTGLTRAPQRQSRSLKPFPATEMASNLSDYPVEIRFGMREAMGLPSSEIEIDFAHVSVCGNEIASPNQRFDEATALIQFPVFNTAYALDELRTSRLRSCSVKRILRSRIT